MQLPATEEVMMAAGYPPIRARKARYFEDGQLKQRIVAPPEPGRAVVGRLTQDDWSNRPTVEPAAAERAPGANHAAGNGGLRWEAEVEPPDLAAAGAPDRRPEIAASAIGPEMDEDADEVSALQARFGRVARQAALDPDDGLGL
jgi:type IV secretion system protein VirD4